MITKDKSKYICSMGIDCAKPQGGIAQVLYIYKKYIFETFRFIPTTTCKQQNFVSRQIVAGVAYVKLLYHLLKHDIKVVHLHAASGKSFFRKWFYIDLCHWFGVKIIFHEHSGNFKDFGEKIRPFIRKILSKCDVIVALSNTWKDYFRSIGFDNVVVIPNPIEPPVTRPLPKDDTRLHLAFLGNIVSRKGIFDLLHAMEGLSGVVLHIGGKGDTARMRREIRNLGLENSVVYHGFVSGEEKEKLFQTCDVYVLPSYAEGFPVSILEAMSYGMPVVASRIGGIPDIIDESKTGLLITPGDIAALRAAIMDLLNDKEKRMAMGRNAEEESKKYLPHRIEEYLKPLYEKFL